MPPFAFKAFCKWKLKNVLEFQDSLQDGQHVVGKGIESIIEVLDNVCRLVGGLPPSKG